MKVYESLLKQFFFPIKKVIKPIVEKVMPPPVKLDISDLQANGELTILFSENLMNLDEHEVSLEVINRIRL